MDKNTLVLVLAAFLLFPMAEAARAGSLEGAWELKRYRLAEEWIDVSGLLILNDGRFAMIYTMEYEPGSLSGRAHAGTYQVDEDRLVFDVRQWVQKVGDTATVVPATIAGADLEATGCELVLHFDGGSVQALEKVRAQDPDAFNGSWHLEDTGRSTHNDTNATSAGSMVAAANQFVLVSLDEDGVGGYAAGGNVENVEMNKKVDLLWEIRVDGSSGVVSAGDMSRSLQIDTSSEQAILVRDADGDLLRFHK